MSKEENTMKHFCSIILAIVLLILGSTALCATEIPKFFYPDTFFELFNRYEADLLGYIYGEASILNVDEAKASMKVSFSEEADGAVYYTNEAGTLVAVAVYFDGKVDRSKPANMLAIFHSKDFSYYEAYVQQAVLGFFCRDMDPSASINDLVAWIQGGPLDGDTMDINGGYVQVNEIDEHFQYSLIRTGIN